MGAAGAARAAAALGSTAAQPTARAKELAVAACADTVRGAGGAFGVGVGGSGGGGLRVAVRKVGVRWRVAVAEEELAAAGCAHAVRGAGAFGVGVGGSGGGGLQRCALLSHRVPRSWRRISKAPRVGLVSMDFVVRYEPKCAF